MILRIIICKYSTNNPVLQIYFHKFQNYLIMLKSTELSLSPKKSMMRAILPNPIRQMPQL